MEQGISPGVMECCTELKPSTSSHGEADGVGAVDAHMPPGWDEGRGTREVPLGGGTCVPNGD